MPTGFGRATGQTVTRREATPGGSFALPTRLKDMLTTLALAMTLTASQGMTLRYAPPAGSVTTFGYRMTLMQKGEDALGQLRWEVAERVAPEGTNTRVTRYIPFATPGQESTYGQRLRQEIGRLAGKTYTFLIAPDGRNLPRKLGKYENPTDGFPALDMSLPGEAVATSSSWVATIGGATGTIAARASVRGTRPLPGDTAVIVDLNPRENAGTEPKIQEGSYAVLSAKDGRYLLAHMVIANPGPGVDAAEVDIRRLNVPGMDKLMADLQFPK